MMVLHAMSPAVGSNLSSAISSVSLPMFDHRSKGTAYPPTPVLACPPPKFSWLHSTADYLPLPASSLMFFPASLRSWLLGVQPDCCFGLVVVLILLSRLLLLSLLSFLLIPRMFEGVSISRSEVFSLRPRWCGAGK